MEQRDSIFVQFGETARCRDAQYGDGVCCAFAAQLVFLFCSLRSMGGPAALSQYVPNFRPSL